jgi:predicted nucleotidyltransferase component of viral defense system
MAIRLHEEDPILFRESIDFTAAETGFVARLIEKDYFCSVLLEHLSTPQLALTFKGGTLLAKVHAGFYRLQLQLDAQLRPVLRRKEFEQFDLDRAFETVASFANAIGYSMAHTTT